MPKQENFIHVIGIGLDGAAGLTHSVCEIVNQADLLIGSSRHLSYFAAHPGEQMLLGDLPATIATIRARLCQTPSSGTIVFLTSGDPLFFGLGRLLLAELPAEQLTFHPHLSSMQLAFSRIKVPWQDARIISAHGRSLEELTQALQQGTEKIGILTDAVHSPNAIARLLLSLDLPLTYQMWVCENLGGADEQVRTWTGTDLTFLAEIAFAPLNVVVLQRTHSAAEFLNLQAVPFLGIPDSAFCSFPDRPGLITKREIRTLILAELELQPQQVIWDVGAGTGSVSIEIARLFPTSQVYAIEKTAIGQNLIRQNCQRFQVENVILVPGTAPDALGTLPPADRVFIGGSGGNLTEILEFCDRQFTSKSVMVLALATVEHLATAVGWFSSRSSSWDFRLLQVQLARSLPVAALTRLNPLNPVTLLTASK